ncbi:MAG: hypothetical protein K2K47_08500 [Duncaniella sp.]|nr:hypothetical protein [Duncaniella sp.]
MSDRHRFRAEWHDYNEGVFFITICSNGQAHIFGKIKNREFYPSPLGKLVAKHIESINERHNNAEIFNYVVMPNHVHFILSTGRRPCDWREGNKGCLQPPCHDEGVIDFHHNSRIAVIVGSFKAGVTREARMLGVTNTPVWQSRFHDHIIRNQIAYEKIMNYIDNNIVNWESDCFCV